MLFDVNARSLHDHICSLDFLRICRIYSENNPTLESSREHFNEVIFLNYGELKQRVTWFLDRSDLTAQVSAWINDARLQLATPMIPGDRPGELITINWPWLWTDAYLTTVSGSADYALPSDYLDHLHVILEDGAGKKKLHGYTQKGWDEQMLIDTLYSESNAEPSEYVLIGQTIRLHPPPDNAYTLRLYYYARPDNFTVNANYDYMSETYPYLIIHKTVLLGSVYLDDPLKLKMHEGLYREELIGAVRREKAKKYQDTNPVVRTWKDFDKNAFANRFQLRKTPGTESSASRREVT